MASIRDVAKLAGVSPATVSRVINGTARVSPETRRRVLESIQQTDFVPNEVARSLFKKSAGIVGLIVPSIRNPYFAQLASALDDVAVERGFRLFLCNVGDDLEQTRSAIQRLSAMNVDGIILVTALHTLPEELDSCPVPIVVLNGLFDRAKVNAYLYCDYRQGGRLAMEHLLDCGCQNIVCIRGPRDSVTSGHRFEGYRDVCLERGLSQQVLECGYGFESGLTAAQELLERYPGVDGILACNDVVALSVYKMLHKRNISVPGQVQLVGFDDLPLASLVTPALTTIRQPIEDMARKAAELVMVPKGTPKTEERFLFPVSLVQRETTRLPPER